MHITVTVIAFFLLFAQMTVFAQMDTAVAADPEAGNSSPDLAVIADFAGEYGDLYNRLRRAIQRWGVDACTAYGWEIHFRR